MKSMLPLRILVVMSLLLAIAHASNSWQRPQRNDESSVADAVKYLQELDNYYSHLSRPRTQFERKTRSIDSYDERPLDQELEAAIALLRLDALDRVYSRHSRPRFGKRNNDIQNVIEEKEDDGLEGDWQAHSQLGER